MEAKNKISVKNISLRIFKAGIKAFIIYIVYLVFLWLTEPIRGFMGQYGQIIDVFFITVLIFTFISELSSGTIYHFVFSFSRELFVILYFITVLNGGTFKMNLENIKLAVNLQFFILMLIFISMLGIAKTLLSAMNFLNEKSEKETVREYY